MSTYQKPGHTVTLKAPYARSVGQGALVGGVFGVATNDVASGDDSEFSVEGIHELAKTSAQAWTQGDAIYWNTSTKLVSNVDSVGPLIGSAMADAANPSSTGQVRLNGASLGMAQAYADTVYARQVRRRCTIAEINAGVTLLAAVTGYKIRMLECLAIAYGGAVGATTTVDVLATQAAGSVKLVAYAQAGLTRSAVLKAGGTNAAVLADGASYVANDEATAVTVGKTGADLTTATGVDIIMTYALDT